MVATDTQENGCERLRLDANSDPDLAQLVSNWPKLSDSIKRAVLTLVNAAAQDSEMLAKNAGNRGNRFSPATLPEMGLR
ncbi:MAG: hypothetical protein NT013_13765 [Planctomycetia bacterium]|nr:hypothetical protein [Planctomycetia bacterium]